MTIKRKSSRVLVRPGQKWLTSDDAAARIAQHGFKFVAHELGWGESTLRAVMRDDGYVFTRKTIWQEPRLPGLEDAGADDEAAEDHAERADQAGVQGAVAGGG